jgi:glycosyltransferase involved in cell wall biosynthesis
VRKPAKWRSADPPFFIDVAMSSTDAPPVLTICIPTYNRPDLFERALRSAQTLDAGAAASVELVVSDNSTDERTQDVARKLLGDWPGPTQYVLNRPGVGAEPNFNRCLDLATGRYVLILHDDDFLQPNGAAYILRAIASAQERDRALLFGVHVVDQHERVLRRQVFRSDTYLPPPEALRRVLSNSSFVRFPAIVVRRDVYSEIGQFDMNLSVRNPVDFDMWVRVFSRFGVRCLPDVSCAYTVHPGALTEAMFAPTTVSTIAGIFDRAAQRGVLAGAEVRRCQRDFFAQFILGATVRRLRVRDREGARRMLTFFRLPEVHALGRSWRWAPVHLAVSAAAQLLPPRPRHHQVEP